VSAYKKYGPWRGFALTAWRILRCNPLGGRGYDPPVWEKFPVGFRATAGPDDD
jgi:putative component of membrane protein insertase Oxa1/YidC/SpoIIIJ protein YidD